jgi:hypothetical protein
MSRCCFSNAKMRLADADLAISVIDVLAGEITAPHNLCELV